MKNADMPAMPLSGDAYTDFAAYNPDKNDSSYNPECQGLTKRETLAMNAPDMPEWFCDLWTKENSHYSSFFSDYIDNGVPCVGLTCEGNAAMFIEWRTYYADALLKELDK